MFTLVFRIFRIFKMKKIIDTTKITNLPVLDIGLERKILKTILLSKQNIDYVSFLSEEDFYNLANKQIFSLFKKLADEGKNVDIYLIPNVIKTSDGFKEIINTEPLFNYELKSYIDGLKKITKQRKIQEIAVNATIKAKEGRDPNAIANWLTEEIEKLETKRPENIKEQNYRIIDELYHELESDGYFGLTTGYRTLDYNIRGLANGTMTVIGGTPSSGKTTWVLNIINHLCKQNKRVLHVNLEMSNIMLQMKMLSINTGISTSTLITKKKELDDDKWKMITNAFEKMSDYKWYRIGEKETSVIDIDNAIKEQGGFDICFIDYLQLLSNTGKKRTRYEDISDISRSLKKLSTKHNIPFVVIASINRNYATREDKMPTMADLRDSGQVEFDSDLILFLNRPSQHGGYDDKYKVDQDQWENYCELLIAKNRWGQANKKIEFLFDGERSRFFEVKRDGK